MKQLFIAIAAFFSLLTVSAQKTIVHDPHAEVRKVEDFHAIKVATGIQLYFTQGSEKAVAVSASDDTYRSKIRTEVKGGVLHIYYDNNNWSFRDHGNKELKAYVSVSQLDGLDGSSGAHIEINGTLKSPSLAVGLSSGAHFDGRIEAGTLSIDQSSGSRMTVSGSAGQLKADASSGSKLSGSDLKADACDVSVSSGGHIDISVQKEMTASAHSGGHVSYNGPGVIKSLHTGSGGSVNRD